MLTYEPRNVIRLIPILTSLVLSSCQTPSRPQAPLNSERIEAKFGSYGIEVLESNPIRISNLYSTHGGKKICRTFAVVEFSKDIPSGLARPLSEILAGASLGATLKTAWWKITKHHLYLDEIASGKRFRTLAHLPANFAGELAVRIYQLNVSKEGPEIAFATIAEVHHPEYLTIDDLKPFAVGSTTPNTKEQKRIDQLLATAYTELAN